MTRSQNSTNKLRLKTTSYPKASRPAFYVSQEDVNAVLADGGLPEIFWKGKPKAHSVKIALLLTQDKSPERTLPDYSMPSATVEAFESVGAELFFVVYDKVEEQLERIKPDGIYLPGGCFDVPLEMEENEPPHQTDLKRYKAYVAMIDYARKNKLPLLGICGGMQVLAGYFGAKIKRVDNHRTNIETFAHEVIIRPKSLLQRIIGAESFKVNSWHRWAVSETSFGQNIVHTAPDGVVEAIEPQESWNPFVLGIQSHPEYFVSEGDKASTAVFKAFVKACKNE